MKVGTSSGGSSGTSPSVAVSLVVGGRAASSMCRKRDAAPACSAAMSNSQAKALSVMLPPLWVEFWIIKLFHGYG